MRMMIPIMKLNTRMMMKTRICRENCDMISENSFAALYSSTNSIENFILCKITAKCQAVENIEDEAGHCFLKGEYYFTGHYLQRDERRSGKNNIAYKVIPEIVFIDPCQIIYPDVNLDIDLRLSMGEFVNITCFTV